MRKILPFLIVLTSLTATAQTDTANFETQKNLIEQSKSHRKMVSFIKYYVGDLQPFWSYLINDLHYKTDEPDNAVNVVATKGGMYAVLHKYSDGYQQTKQILRVAFTCKKDGSDVTQVKITGPLSLLYELYLSYWETHVKPDFTKSGAFEKTYLPPYETIWLYHDKILILPFKQFDEK